MIPTRVSVHCNQKTKQLGTKELGLIQKKVYEQNQNTTKMTSQ